MELPGPHNRREGCSLAPSRLATRLLPANLQDPDPPHGAAADERPGRHRPIACARRRSPCCTGCAAPGASGAKATSRARRPDFRCGRGDGRTLAVHHRPERLSNPSTAFSCFGSYGAHGPPPHPTLSHEGRGRRRVQFQSPLPSWERALKRGAPTAKQAARKRAAGGWVRGGPHEHMSRTLESMY
jgi:hypothetical protein